MMQKELFDTDEYEVITCESCGAELDDESDRRDCDEACVNCYENCECPGYCNDDHDSPEPNAEGLWECPTTGTTYVLDAGDWEVAGPYDTSTYVDIAEQWYIEPSEHGYGWCEGCDVWRCDGELVYSDYETNCTRCARTRHNEPETHSVQCEVGDHRATITHWHPITEAVSCAEHAHNHPGFVPIPVLVAA